MHIDPLNDYLHLQTIIQDNLSGLALLWMLRPLEFGLRRGWRLSRALRSGKPAELLQLLLNNPPRNQPLASEALGGCEAAAARPPLHGAHARMGENGCDLLAGQELPKPLQDERVSPTFILASHGNAHGVTVRRVRHVVKPVAIRTVGSVLHSCSVATVARGVSVGEPGSTSGMTGFTPLPPLVG